MHPRLHRKDSGLDHWSVTANTNLEWPEGSQAALGFPESQFCYYCAEHLANHNGTNTAILFVQWDETAATKVWLNLGMEVAGYAGIGKFGEEVKSFRRSPDVAVSQQGFEMLGAEPGAASSEAVGRLQNDLFDRRSLELQGGRVACGVG